MKVVMIKYNAGNVCSIESALLRLGIKTLLTDKPEEILSADKVIFPGVGAAGTAMNYLKERQLDAVIKNLQQPVLAICLGMQLLCDYSEEDNTTCLGIFKQKVRKFNNGEKVPLIGWNNIYTERPSLLMKNINQGAYMYFAHSYYAHTCEHTIGTAWYNEQYSAALQKDNFYAVQFHPEKSATAGQQLISNFMDL